MPKFLPRMLIFFCLRPAKTEARHYNLFATSVLESAYEPVHGFFVQKSIV
jgi:hypothetical protein